MHPLGEVALLPAADRRRQIGAQLLRRQAVEIAADAVAPGEAEVKRMSVARELRRQGIGAALLRELIAIAAPRGWRVVRLETTAEWKDAVGFYSAFGFELTHYEDGPFCRDAHFRLDISPASASTQ